MNKNMLKNNNVKVKLDSVAHNPSTKFLKLAYWNARSINNKKICLYDYLANQNIDFLCLSETWLSDKSDPENMNNVTTNAILPEGFSINHVPRTDGRDGGGVGFISNKMVDAKVDIFLVNQNYKQFESMTVLLKFNNFAVYISVVYRPRLQK